ncbi:hypothetical protein ONZ43_g522 [Nemania bipapillata]|uniref:Uncharacterized protein n=1 Tax=Nemania bipapillata TaxID=110536 RepID=A0ACC2J7U9_9PEZI|nr:hypothetical protein ONZ43_g522 [Nemania bipapillata]
MKLISLAEYQTPSTMRLSAKMEQVAYLQAVLRSSTDEDKEWEEKFAEAERIHHEIIQEKTIHFGNRKKLEGEGEDEESLLARNQLANFYAATRRLQDAYEVRRGVLEEYRRFLPLQKEIGSNRGYLTVMRAFAEDCEGLAFQFARIEKRVDNEGAFSHMPSATPASIRSAEALMSKAPDVQLGVRSSDLDDHDMANLPPRSNTHKAMSEGGDTQSGSNYGSVDREAHENFIREGISARRDVLAYTERFSGPVPDADVLRAKEDLAECLLRWDSANKSSRRTAIELLKQSLTYWEEEDRLGKCPVTEKLRERIKKAEDRVRAYDTHDFRVQRIEEWISKVEDGSMGIE